MCFRYPVTLLDYLDKRRRKDMATKKQEAKNMQLSRNTTTPQKDVQRRYQQDLSRYKQQIERVSKIVNSPKAA
jgi:hypothetical protein